MGNCLETKLKAGVDNNNLPIFGCASFVLTTFSDALFSFQDLESATLIGNAHFTDGTTDKGQTTDLNLFHIVDAQAGDILMLKNKYTTTYLYFPDKETVSEGDTSWFENATYINLGRYNDMPVVLEDVFTVNIVATTFRAINFRNLTGSLEACVERQLAAIGA